MDAPDLAPPHNGTPPMRPGPSSSPDTDICVLKTAVDAFERDLSPWVLKDACASHAGPEAHDAGLLITERFIGANQIIRTTSLPESVLPLPA